MLGSGNEPDPKVNIVFFTILLKHIIKNSSNEHIHDILPEQLQACKNSHGFFCVHLHCVLRCMCNLMEVCCFILGN